MTAISGGDLTLLRAKGHKTIERLYGFGYPVVWTGLVNQSNPDRGTRTFTYYTGSLETNFAFSDIQTGLDVWVSSTAGTKNLGVRRLRSISGNETTGTIVVDWHDDMDVADNSHITIIHNYGVWPKYSWFEATGPTFKKDGPDGEVYTSQTKDSPPQVIMSRNYASEDAATIAIDASDSVATASGAAISSHAWSFTPSSLAGVSIASASSAATTITLPADSKVWVHCVVTDDNDKTSTGHRAIIIGGGITEFERGALSHRFGATNVSLQITSTHTDTDDWADFDDRSLVIVTAEDYFGSTQKTISFRGDSRYDDRQHIMFSGYMTGETWQLGQGGSGAIAMQCATSLSMFLYSVSLTGADSPASWLEMHTSLMTVAGNIFHLFYYHSTLLDVSDVHLPWADTTKRSANDEFGEGNLLQKATSLAAKRFNVLTSNPQGEVFIEEDLNLSASATRSAATTIITLTDEDVQPTKSTFISRHPGTIVITVSGGSSTGKPGTFAPLFATSNNVAIADAEPSKRSFDRLMLADQTDANAKAARQLAVINRVAVGITGLSMAGNYREVLSPATQEWIDTALLFDADLIGNIRSNNFLENRQAIVRAVTVQPLVNGFQQISVDLDFEAPDGLGGITVPAPAVPDTTDSSSGSYSDPWDVPANTSTPTSSQTLIVLNDDTYVSVSTDSGATYTEKAV